MANVVFIGWPKRMGGACKERYHTGKLLAQSGHSITYIKDDGKPTYVDDEPLLEEAKKFATLIEPKDEFEIYELVKSLDNPIVIGMASGFYDRGFGPLNLLAKTIWVPCMCYVEEAMKPWLERGNRPAHAIFQSQYQSDQFSNIENLNQSVINGLYSELGDTPPERQTGKVILKLCRPDPDKFPADYWAQCQEIFDKTGYITRVVGYSDDVEAKIGKPPGCVSVHPPRSLSLSEAFAGASYLFPGFGACVENWPQVAYEAIEHGTVPLFPCGSGGANEMSCADTVHDMDHLCKVVCFSAEARCGYLRGYARNDIANARRKWLDLIEQLEAI